MDLRQFRYFVQVARRENFRKASDDLRIAQSALTRQIQHLESELGFLLFDRVKRGVRLTAAGQRLLERSQHILGEVDRLKETLQIEAHVMAQHAAGEVVQLVGGANAGERTTQCLTEALQRVPRGRGVHRLTVAFWASDA